MTESGQAIRPISYSLKAFIGIDDNFAIAIAWISSIETASSKDKELPTYQNNQNMKRKVRCIQKL